MDQLKWILNLIELAKYKEKKPGKKQVIFFGYS